MPSVGIDTLCFYTPAQYLCLNELANARQVNAKKYRNGFGQYHMSIPTPDEDVVTMAANATQKLLQKINKNEISMIIFATESSVDQSKSAGLYLHHLLGMPAACRVIEIKQACYSATAALRLALSHVEKYTDEKVLVVASDIPRYGLAMPGEPSHGAGAVAMCICNQPRTLEIHPHAGYHAEDQMDFWRPNYSKEAFVSGKLSCELYYRFLLTTWDQYKNKSQNTLLNIDHFCFHVPIPRLVEKALDKLLSAENIHPSDRVPYHKKLSYALHYGRYTGNCYTASLYISLISLLDHAENLTHSTIGLYSYGSGSMGEFFSGTVQENYQQHSFKDEHQAMLKARTPLDIKTYESYYQYHYPTDGQYHAIPHHTSSTYRLAAFDQHKRIYDTCDNQI